MRRMKSPPVARAQAHGYSAERLLPFGQAPREWIVRYIAEARPAILGVQQTDALFVTSHGHGMSRVMFWMLVKQYALLAGIHSPL